MYIVCEAEGILVRSLLIRLLTAPLISALHLHWDWDFLVAFLLPQIVYT